MNWIICHLSFFTIDKQFEQIAFVFEKNSKFSIKLTVNYSPFDKNVFILIKLFEVCEFPIKYSKSHSDKQINSLKYFRKLTNFNFYSTDFAVELLEFSQIVRKI